MAAGVRWGEASGRHWAGGARAVDAFDAKADALAEQLKKASEQSDKHAKLAEDSQSQAKALQSSNEGLASSFH